MFCCKDDITTYATTVNGATSYEYAIGDIKLHPRSVNLLAKHAEGIDITTVNPSEEIVKEIEKIEEKFESGELNKIDAGVQINQQLYPTVEFVFLHKEKKHKPAYIVGFNEWSLTDVSA